MFNQPDATFQAGKQYQITILNVVKNVGLHELRKRTLGCL